MPMDLEKPEAGPARIGLEPGYDQPGRGFSSSDIGNDFLPNPATRDITAP
jgi:hypothetical protein